MFIKNKTKVLTITIIILTLLFLTGCLGSSTNETQIKQIAKNIEKAIEKKNVDLFMENISYNYSDTEGGTYDNHINGLPEEIFSKIEEAEEKFL
jgi:PBP1b-binding outer membrane lipoprotein LpoB